MRYDTWQQAFKDAVRDPAELCRLLDLPYRGRAGAAQAARDFPLFVPRGYIARMRPGDPRDPLLRQVLPLEEETATPHGYSIDPVGDVQAALTPGLLHKYRSRVLMVATGACAVHCRYCFRRHYPYGEAPHAVDDWQPAVAQISADSTLREVILSGGDPLSLVDAYLEQLILQLAEIPHLRRLRIHTRLPIMIPERVTDALLRWLRATRLAPIMVVHANHANELDQHVAAAMARLADAGIVLLNQTVLLKGVNDDVEALADLCERLVDLRVMPYYLHQLDRVVGAAHFAVPLARGQRLVAALRRRLPGYAVPRYVREIAGLAHKTVLA
ncbi:MAG: EF-P beta-lysylation protein EpmB [Pirellulales bacterium]